MADTKQEKRPYELTGQKYALWYDVGSLGPNAQAAVAKALCSESVELKCPYPLDARTLKSIAEMAKQRGVFLRIPKAP